MVEGGGHDLLPQLAGRQRAVNPDTVVSSPDRRPKRFGRLGPVHQIPVGIGFDGAQKGVGDGDRDIEVGQLPGAILGVDEVLDVRVITAQHAHLRAAPAAGRFDSFARAIEYPHVGNGARRVRGGALDPRAPGPDAREVIADAATPAHCLGRFAQRDVDAGLAVRIGFGDGIADRLHEAVDQRGLNVGAGCRHDAAGRDESALQGIAEARFPGIGVGLHRGQCPGDTGMNVSHRGFTRLGVFFSENVFRNRLGWHGFPLGYGHCNPVINARGAKKKAVSASLVEPAGHGLSALPKQSNQVL